MTHKLRCEKNMTAEGRDLADALIVFVRPSHTFNNKQSISLWIIRFKARKRRHGKKQSHVKGLKYRKSYVK